MNQRYRITSTPTYEAGTALSDFVVGQIVERFGEYGPDIDGDIRVRHAFIESEWEYIAVSCLTEITDEPVAPRNNAERVSVKALRAALHVVGSGTSVTDADAFVRLVTAIDTALLA